MTIKSKGTVVAVIVALAASSLGAGAANAERNRSPRGCNSQYGPKMQSGQVIDHKFPDDSRRTQGCHDGVYSISYDDGQGHVTRTTCTRQGGRETCTQEHTTYQ